MFLAVRNAGVLPFSSVIVCNSLSCLRLRFVRARGWSVQMSAASRPSASGAPGQNAFSQPGPSLSSAAGPLNNLQYLTMLSQMASAAAAVTTRTTSHHSRAQSMPQTQSHLFSQQTAGRARASSAPEVFRPSCAVFAVSKYDCLCVYVATCLISLFTE